MTIEEALITLKDRAVTVGARAAKVAEIMDAWRVSEPRRYTAWCGGSGEWPSHVRLAHAELRDAEAGLIAAARAYHDAGVAAVLASADTERPAEAEVAS